MRIVKALGSVKASKRPGCYAVTLLTLVTTTLLTSTARADDAMTSGEVKHLIFMGELIAGIAVLLGILWFIVSMWDMIRSKPPASEKFSTKEDLNAVEERLTDRIAHVETSRSTTTKDLHTKMDGLTRTIQDGFNGVNRSLGYLEGTTNLGKQIVEALKDFNGKH